MHCTDSQYYLVCRPAYSLAFGHGRGTCFIVYLGGLRKNSASIKTLGLVSMSSDLLNIIDIRGSYLLNLSLAFNLCLAAELSSIWLQSCVQQTSGLWIIYLRLQLVTAQQLSLNTTGSSSPLKQATTSTLKY